MIKRARILRRQIEGGERWLDVVEFLKVCFALNVDPLALLADLKSRVNHEHRRSYCACSNYLKGLAGHEFDVLEVAKPVSPEAAVNLKDNFEIVAARWKFN